MGSLPESFDGGGGAPAEIELDDAAHGVGTVDEASVDAGHDDVEPQHELKDEQGRTWTVHESVDGPPYYFCPELGTTQWERPT